MTTNEKKAIGTVVCGWALSMIVGWFIGKKAGDIANGYLDADLEGYDDSTDESNEEEA